MTTFPLPVIDLEVGPLLSFGQRDLSEISWKASEKDFQTLKRA